MTRKAGSRPSIPDGAAPGCELVTPLDQCGRDAVEAAEAAALTGAAADAAEPARAGTGADTGVAADPARAGAEAAFVAAPETAEAPAAGGCEAISATGSGRDAAATATALRTGADAAGVRATFTIRGICGAAEAAVPTAGGVGPRAVSWFIAATTPWLWSAGAVVAEAVGAGAAA